MHFQRKLEQKKIREGVWNNKLLVGRAVKTWALFVDKNDYNFLS